MLLCRISLQVFQLDDENISSKRKQPVVHALLSHSFLGIGLVVFCLARQFIIIVSLRRFVATVVFHLQKANKFFAFFLLTVKCCDVTETIRQLTLGQFS